MRGAGYDSILTHQINRVCTCRCFALVTLCHLHSTAVTSLFSPRSCYQQWSIFSSVDSLKGDFQNIFLRSKPSRCRVLEAAAIRGGAPNTAFLNRTLQRLRNQNRQVILVQVKLQADACQNPPQYLQEGIEVFQCKSYVCCPSLS
jgi:hypothetical protein